MNRIKKVQISNFPKLTSQDKTRVLTGVRPFRKGGIRLQIQQIGQKSIIHNYGHGGAGVSLAPATGQEASIFIQTQINTKKIKDSLKQNRTEVAVLGCGIIGIFSALYCAQKGYKVTVYAQRIPIPLEKNTERMCTSQVAPGYWLPYHYQYPQSQQEKHNVRSDISFKKYKEWIQKLKLKYENYQQFMRIVPVYEDMDIQQLKKKAPDFISNSCQIVNLQIGGLQSKNPKQFKMVYFQTIQIHMQNFLQQLIYQCKSKGVTFNTKKINQLDEILGLKQTYIINCLGLGSKYIFGDKNMYGVKGHLIQIKNTTKIRGIFGFSYAQKKTDKDGKVYEEFNPVKLYCFNDKILLGLTKEYKQTLEINHQLVKQLEERVHKFYYSLTQNQNKSKGNQVRSKL